MVSSFMFYKILVRKHLNYIIFALIVIARELISSKVVTTIIRLWAKQGLTRERKEKEAK
jgi:hypothetical protein